MDWRDKQAEEKHWHWRTHLTWLRPGLGVKRWLLLIAIGVGLLSFGGAFALRALYPLPRYFYYLTLQFLPQLVRAVLFLLVGGGLLTLGLWGLNRTLLAPFMDAPYSALPGKLYEYRRRGRGPKVVVIGGGHGQAMMLRGLKRYTSNLTAIVTVADDGGSSGRLRRQLGILPPGDFRNCITALADDEALVTRLFQYRFAGDGELSGHSFGNLFISAMADITGAFESALAASSRVLAVQGRVLPSTLETVILCADMQRLDGSAHRVCGESNIPQSEGQILRVMLVPSSPSAYPEAVRGILEAELIVIGPGSLYTSILPNLSVPDIAEALRATTVPRVYICNVATQIGETDDYTAQRHYQTLVNHVGQNVFSTAIVNTRYPNISLPEGVAWVRADLESHKDLHVIQGAFVDPAVGWRHDSEKLAHEVMALLA